ncbi:MAG: hypothetical protein V4727_05530 [Verrucomicrobiota bacterium]
MESESPIKPEQGRRFPSRRLLIIVALVVIGLVVYFYKRTPDFSGSKVSAIEIKMYEPIGSMNRELLVEASLKDPSACASVFNFLSSAHRGSDHKCASIGSFEVHYADGKTDILSFLPGHDPEAYEFRFDGGLYLLPREQFFQTLRDAGVDSSKMPKSEH